MRDAKPTFMGDAAPESPMSIADISTVLCWCSSEPG